METDLKTTPYSFAIPAPRGQILDSQGRPLARMRAVQRLVMHVPPLEQETPEAFVAWVKEQWPQVVIACPRAEMPQEEALQEHFKSRRRLPMPISAVFVDPLASDSSAPLPDFLKWRAEYLRDYPHGELAAHAIGYVAPVGPVAGGPLHHGESLWRQVEGKEGLEASLEKELSGKPGLMLLNYDWDTHELTEKMVIAPEPGHDVVTTLNIDLQESAEKALIAAQRPGALVVVDASTGNVLALASAPTFDPGMFAAGASNDDFKKLASNEGKPLHHRAVASLYPPGSVTKPFVALATLRSGAVLPTTRLQCGPELEIDGRSFGNWSETDAGWFDLRAALVRSCNTYFYQTAMAAGGPAVLASLADFGFGGRDEFPLTSFLAGKIPAKVPNRQALANLSIGQGEFLTTPLHVAMGMAGLAHGRGRPGARLVMMVQSQEGKVLAASEPTLMHRFEYPAEHLAAVREGMYGVVNHQQGTASKARLEKVRVHGKTGTAEWSTGGKRANVVWFGGFITDCTPPLAYAVALEGKPGEKVSGGLTAAPVMGQLLAEVFQAPERYGITPGGAEAPLQKDPLLSEPEPQPVFAQDVNTMIQPGTVDALPGSAPLRAEPVYDQAAPAQMVPASAGPASARPGPAVTLTTLAPSSTSESPVTTTVQPLEAGPAQVIREPATAVTAMPAEEMLPPDAGREQPPLTRRRAPVTVFGGKGMSTVPSPRPQPKQAPPPRALAVEEEIPAESTPRAASEAMVDEPPSLPVKAEAAGPAPTRKERRDARSQANAPATVPPPASESSTPSGTVVVVEPGSSPPPRVRAANEPQLEPAAMPPPTSKKEKGRAASAPPKAVAVDAPASTIPKALPADGTAAPPPAIPEATPAPEPPKRKFKLFGKSDD